MTRRQKSAPAQGSGPDLGTCCRVDAVVAVDERGQMVLPKDVREKAGIRPGDKLALASWQHQGEVCCLFLMKADKLADMVKTMLGPLTKGAAGR